MKKALSLFLLMFLLSAVYSQRTIFCNSGSDYNLSKIFTINGVSFSMNMEGKICQKPFKIIKQSNIWFAVAMNGDFNFICDGFILSRKGKVRGYVVYSDAYDDFFAYSFDSGDLSRFRNKSISYDLDGRIEKVGDTRISYEFFSNKIEKIGGVRISYDFSGNVEKIGDKRISYNFDKRLEKIGGTRISYDLDKRVERMRDSRISYDFDDRISRVGEARVKYNYENRVVDVDGVSISYDSDERVNKVGHVKIVYDSDDEIYSVGGNKLFNQSRF
ncbi:hypothetical protein MT996_00415 [Ornithobacterium rhinotracheale]|uniref:hypothetical protein n=1 Tax=Ornithobacterium rhinotracheale TaxID=28251 RepID=UPI00129CC6F9|nr:hypothetical protein [Ornithobacterium rhinotracheale]UOH77949.1 hypothetical protein MT996_00415 [Ornithobacterium rhinotracheale]